jgi:hypothetical protein
MAKPFLQVMVKSRGDGEVSSRCVDFVGNTQNIFDLSWLRMSENIS